MFDDKNKIEKTKKGVEKAIDSNVKLAVEL